MKCESKMKLNTDLSGPTRMELQQVRLLRPLSSSSLVLHALEIKANLTRLVRCRQNLTACAQ